MEAHISRSHRNSLSLAGCYGCDSNVTNLSTSRSVLPPLPPLTSPARRNSFLRLHAQYLSSSSGPLTSSREGAQLVTSVVLERSGLPVLPTNRVIPVIQEEHSSPQATSPLLPPSPLHTTKTSLAVVQYSEGGLTLLDLSHSQPVLLPGVLSPHLALPRQSLSSSCPNIQ